jgi:hypothetical protein
MITYYHASEGQLVFDRTLAQVPFFWNQLVKAFSICSPLRSVGYIIRHQFLEHAFENTVPYFTYEVDGPDGKEAFSVQLRAV